MASRDEINAKRLQASKRHRAASQKVSRLKSKDVLISGTKYDPRVAPEKIKRYTSKQLDAYIAKVDSFVSRETQFVAGAKGKPLPATGGRYTWGNYARMQKQLNKDKAKGLADISDIYIPSQGMTVGERVEMSTPKHPVMSPPASYAPHIPYSKSSRGIPNEKQLKELVRDMERKQGGAYFEKKHKSQLTAAKKMIKGISNKELAKEFKSLTPWEFNLLWNYTNFAEVTATDYVIRQSMMHDKKELAWYDHALNTQLSQAKERIKEIKAISLVRKSANLGI